MAIGAQNAFVLKQGIMKNYVFLTALFCALVDSLMISLGAGGIGSLLSENPLLLSLTKWAGAAFLFGYGLRSFKAVFTNHSLIAEGGPAKPSLKETLITLAALGFLNPHVYIDAVVLLGSISAQFETLSQPYFALGAIFASWVWFFTLCYGARLLAPLFAKPIAWKILDAASGTIMWFIGYSLLFTDFCSV